MDETRIEHALREGPPFRAHYVSRPLPLSEAGPHGSRLLALVAITVVLLVAASGAVLVGSGIVELPAPLPPGASAAPAPGGDAAWRATGSLATARSGHSATMLPDGTLLVAGGNTGPADAPTDTVERYDPVTGSWSPVASMSSPRTGHSATLLPDGTVLVAGGWNGSVVVASTERFDPGTGTWTAVAAMSHPRGGHLTTLLADGTVLVVGGHDDSPVPGGAVGASTTLASAERYDYHTDSWTSAGSMTEARGWNMTLTLLPDGTVLAAGGSVWDAGWVSLASAETYEPDSGVWTATADMRHPRGGGQSATLLPDGTVLVVGLGPPEMYDPSARAWIETASPVWTRSSHTATLLPEGLVLVAGGALGGGDNSFTDRVEWYDPRSGAWTATGPLNVARKGQTATLLPDGTVLVVGGHVGITSVGTHADWQQTASAELYVWARSD